MIRSKDVNKGLKPLELKVEQTPNKVSLADVLKAQILIAKMLRDVRTNQVTALVHGLGGGKDKLIKPTKVDQRETKEEKK